MSCLTKSIAVVAAILFVLLLAPGSRAQEIPVNVDNMSAIFGIGIGVAPDYQGSNDYKAIVLPFGKYTFAKSERYIQLSGTQLFANLLNDRVLRFGPIANYRLGRGHDVDDRAVKNMTVISDTVELGGFFGVEFKEAARPRHRFLASVNMLFDAGGGYNGYNMNLNARYWYPVSRSVDIGIGAGASYADGAYTSTYFSVTPYDASQTGLPVYSAHGGMKDVSVTPAVLWHINKEWHLGGGVRYGRLLNDAKNSPVTDDRGSANQVTGVVGIAYSWQ